MLLNDCENSFYSKIDANSGDLLVTEHADKFVVPATNSNKTKLLQKNYERSNQQNTGKKMACCPGS